MVSFEVGVGENVPGIPGACATRNFAYLVRSPFRCEYISCIKMIGQLKGHMGLDSLECYRLKRLSSLDFAQFRKCHAIFHEKFCNSLPQICHKVKVQVVNSHI